MATEHVLWEGFVVIILDNSPGKAEFVVQECLNSGTRDFLIVFGDITQFFDVLTSPRYAEYINPTTRFPKLKVSEIDSDSEYQYVRWEYESDVVQHASAVGCGTK